MHLAKEGPYPLVMSIYSGAKSLHSIFNVKGVSEFSLRKWFSQAVTIGADHTQWQPSQFSRLPLGTNQKTGRRQTVYYFNPEAVAR